MTTTFAIVINTGEKALTVAERSEYEGAAAAMWAASCAAEGGTPTGQPTFEWTTQRFDDVDDEGVVVIAAGTLFVVAAGPAERPPHPPATPP